VMVRQPVSTDSVGAAGVETPEWVTHAVFY
jgi:hypothetical protein